jgi:single-stranded-DNA-specific exonuclease
VKKVWKINKKAPEKFLEKFPEFSKLTLQLLWDRKLKTQKTIDEFFSPDYDQDLHDPFLMKDIKKAIKRIERASKNNEKVAIFADYDADGICGGIILHEILKTYNINPEVYIPDRNIEGYGLNLKAIKQIAQKDVRLILTVDCGITDVEEVKLANELGMDVIIVDHHHVPENIPKACAVINPKQKKCIYPFKELSGAGVAFKLLQAVRITNKLPIAWEKWLLDLVAISTVTDSMVLLGENRTLVKYGLIVLSQTKRLGLRVLMDKARINGNLTTYSIGFVLGPRINAASRIDHGTVAFRLLLTNDKSSAEELAQKLENRNQERQRQMEKIIKEAREKAKNNCASAIIFEGGETWTSGIVGLVAQKLRDEFWKPAFICQTSEGHAVCSARGGVAGFDVIKALDKCKNLLDEYGGHPFAGAFRADVKNLGKIKNILEKFAKEKFKKEDTVAFLDIDAEIDIKELNWKTFDEIAKFEPFGEENFRPLFLLKDLKIIGMRNVGSKENHLKLSLEKKVEINSADSGVKKINAIGFNLVDSCDKIELGDKIDIVFEMLSNEWNGNKELQLKIVDLKKI